MAEGTLNDTVGRQVFVQFAYLDEGGDVAISDVCGVVLSSEVFGSVQERHDGPAIAVSVPCGEEVDGEARGVVEEICRRLGERAK
jgi:hypothetical protein